MNYDALRDRMVREQLLGRGITSSRVLRAFEKVERHEFVPANMRDTAYADHPLPIGDGQTISQPYMVALMTEQLELKGDEKVLEVGTGSGYQAAILAELATEVYSVERFPILADKAEEALKRLGYSNVRINIGDGTLGWKEHEPFDRIIVTAGAPRVPDSLISQLGDPGRLVIPIGGAFSQALTVVKKNEGGVSQEEVCGCVFVPLIGKEGWKKEN
ncbi:MAG: protein-L-isoaspartate(D-aspartate) O-methyltransferase [Candidatus Omnitrophota bacterium]